MFKTLINGTLILFFLSTTFAYSQITPTYDDILIPMSDSKNLSADVYIPAGCTSCEVVLVQTPYNKNLFEWSLPLGIGQNVDDQPFIWVIVDWRGFYGSLSAAVPNPNRGQDGYDICEWIVDQPWHADRIGTWGPSALGNIQYQLIGKHHPNHTCAIPIVSNPQFSYASYFTGGVLEEARLEQLDALGYGLSPIVMANVYYSIYWQAAENATYYPNQIEIPTLQIGGWYDHNIDEMMTFYKNARNESAIDVQDEQWLLVGPWVHGGTGIANVGSSAQGELSYPNAAGDNDSLAWKFLKYYLLDSTALWQNVPKIMYYELGTNTWHYSDDDDIESQSTQIMYLNSMNRITSETGNGSSSFLSDPMDPSPTIGGATLHPDLEQGPYDQTYLDGRDDIYTFETEPFTSNINVIGRITVKLFISATTPDCDIAIRLVDVYPDGTNMLITDGIKRMRFRNGYNVSDESLMTPGDIYEVDIELPFTNYTWLVDHQMKIYVGGNSSIRWNVNMQDGGAMYTSTTAQTSTITIHHNSNYQSRLILPSESVALNLNEQANTSIQVYPNPSNGILYLNTNEKINAFEVYNLSGNLLIAENYNSPKIDLNDFPNGLYILRVIMQNETEEIFKVSVIH